MSGWKLDAEMQAEVDKCHIYIITSRPYPYYVPASITHEGNKLSGEIGYRVNGEEKRLPFKDWQFVLPDEAVELRVDEYPHRDIWSYDGQGNRITYMPATFLASIYGSQGDEGDLNQFEVLYVGQAIGKGNRSAQERLLNHSTLQKILARTQHDYPDKEINIFMLQFEHEQMISSMDGTADEADKSDENEKRFFNVMDNPPDQKQKIAMVEAGLIRYFQPPYNEVFKIKFPSTKLKTLQSCVKLDVSGLIVELNLRNFNFYLYSQSIESSLTHLAKYDFFSAKNRVSFFNVAGFSVMPDIIKAEK